MSADYSNIQSQPQTRNGLAIASLVLGIISIPTIALLGIGAITAIALGAIAICRIKKEPAIYSGMKMAIAGIIAGAVSLLLIPTSRALAIEALRQSLFRDKIPTPIQTLRTIHNCQAQFVAIKWRFGTLKELSEMGCIDQSYATGAPVSGYIYTSAGETTEDKYCVQATRQSSSTASSDFNIIEDGFIRFVESKTPSPIPHGEGARLGEPSSPGREAQ